jgi:hypothetical protein
VCGKGKLCHGREIHREVKRVLAMGVALRRQVICAVRLPARSGSRKRRASIRCLYLFEVRIYWDSKITSNQEI